jgi:inorganic pyrophosphatase
MTPRRPSVRFRRAPAVAAALGFFLVPAPGPIAAEAQAGAYSHGQADPCALGGPGPSTGPLVGLAQPAGAPDELLALVEIAAGSAIKYELHEGSGRMEVDRFLAMPMAYPLNYGILPCTLAEDNDALDILLITRFPVAPGSVIRVRPVGVLRMLDRGEEDHKLLVVPVDAVDPTWSHVRGPEDLPGAELDRIEAFFRVYKQLPDPTVQVEVGPWDGLEAARATIEAALAAARRP